jgi:hypothetical protein
MAECQLKGLCYNFDDRYFPGHNCKEQNFFMSISEDVFEEEIETPPVPKLPDPTNITPPIDPPEVKIAI